MDDPYGSWQRERDDAVRRVGDALAELGRVLGRLPVAPARQPRVDSQGKEGAERPRLLYTLVQAAELLSVSDRYVWHLADEGELETIKLGRRRLVPADALWSFVERQRGQ